MSTSYKTPKVVDLTGDDARLDYLVNVEGVDQLTASRLVWGGPLGAPPAAEQAWVRVTVRQIVHERLSGVLAWLGRTL